MLEAVKVMVIVGGDTRGSRGCGGDGGSEGKRVDGAGVVEGTAQRTAEG